MRSVASASFIALLAVSSAAFADAYSDAAGRQAGTRYTPSGAGDPAAIVCRAPQPSGGGMGPKVCMHNSVWAQLAMTGKELAPDGRTVFDRPMVDNPRGDGAPDAVTCRKPQALPTAWHLRDYGPEVCLTNGSWASLKAGHKQIAADGKSIYKTDLAVPGPIGPFGTSGISTIPAAVVH